MGAHIEPEKLKGANEELPERNKEQKFKMQIDLRESRMKESGKEITLKRNF